MRLKLAGAAGITTMKDMMNSTNQKICPTGPRQQIDDVLLGFQIGKQQPDALQVLQGVEVFQQVCREVVPVVQDTMTVFFGSPNGGINNGLTAAGTATNNLVQYAPPIVIAPGGNFDFTRIRASQSGADSYSFSFGYIER
jgi:hypothetical protein